MTLLPKELFVEKIASELNKIEKKHFDPSCESFYLRGSTLYYVHQDESVRFVLEDLEGIPVLPTLPDRHSKAFKALRSRSRSLNEVCVPHVTRRMCNSCVEDNQDKECLMKVFHSLVEEYQPGPHHGGEFGDVSFPTRMRGNEVHFKGLLKKFDDGEATIRSSFGRDILSQIMGQDAGTRSASALAIITCTRMHPSLLAGIETFVRSYQGKLCIIKEDQLMRIIAHHDQHSAV